MAQAPSVLAQRNYMSKRESEISVPVALGLGKVFGGGSREGFVQGGLASVYTWAPLCSPVHLPSCLHSSGTCGMCVLLHLGPGPEGCTCYTRPCVPRTCRTLRNYVLGF